MTSFDTLNHYPARQQSHPKMRVMLIAVTIPHAIDFLHLTRGTTPGIHPGPNATLALRISIDSRSTSSSLFQSDTALSASARPLVRQARPDSLPSQTWLAGKGPPALVLGPSAPLPGPLLAGGLPCLAPSMPQTDNQTSMAGNMSGLPFELGLCLSSSTRPRPRKKKPPHSSWGIEGMAERGRGPGYSETVAL